MDCPAALSAALPVALLRRESSAINLFLNFVVTHSVGDKLEFDTSGLLSRECFDEWCTSRRGKPLKKGGGEWSLMSKVARSRSKRLRRGKEEEEAV